MKKFIIHFIILFFIFPAARSQELKSAVYNAETAPVIKLSSGEIRNYFKSPTRYLEMFEVNLFTVYSGKSGETYQVDNGSDELIIIKEGVAEIKVNEDVRILGTGSLVVASSGHRVTIMNNQNSNLIYYSFRFKPYPSEAQKKVSAEVSPVFMDWKSIEYKPNASGGRRDFMRKEFSALKELEIHVTTLNNGLSSHSGHSHLDEEFVLMRYGNTEMDLDGIHYKGGPGSLFFLASEGIHSINNIGTTPCEYYAIRWLTNRDM